MGEKRRETETTFCITERFSNDKDFIRMPWKYLQKSNG